MTSPFLPRPCIRSYEGSRCLAEISEGALGGAQWEADLSRKPAGGGVEDWIVEARVTDGRAVACAAGVRIAIPSWSRAHFLLMPGAVYAGNRFESRKVGYPPKHQPADCRPDTPPLVSDIQRLQLGEGTSRIQILAGAMATPCVAAFDPATKTGWIVLAPPNAAQFEPGFDFLESDDRTSATLRITAPGVREQRYQFMNASAESSDRGADFGVGEGVSFRLQAHVFPCENVQALFDRVFDLRKALVPPAHPPAGLSIREAFDLIEAHYNTTMWWEEAGLYRTNIVNEWSNNPYQTGWCGGIIAEYALLAGGAAGLTRERCLRHLGNALTTGIASSGLFFGKFVNDAWHADCFFENGDHAWRRPLTLIRRQGDALLYSLRAFDFLESQGETLPPQWLAGARRAAEALVAMWDKFGQFGQWVDQFSGEVVIGNSASGGIIPAALCGAERRFGGGNFLRVAQESAGHFYQHFTRQGVTTGGPGDALQCPDSESSYALVESYVELHETTGDPLWLDRAGEAARQFATWVMAYDYRFPAESLFSRLGIQTTGAVFSNSQNVHAAPGICTHSGLGLLKLTQATGDGRYRELACEIANMLPQCVSTAERPMIAKDGQILPPGWLNERCNTSDWDDNVGGVFYGPCWCEASLLLTHAELRGIA
jgi:hypothetical protein